MFNSTYVHAPQAPNYAQQITKHEHRAPTDESIKLLREMEAKAQNQVMQALASDRNNVLQGIIVDTRPMVGDLGMQHQIYFAFQLNGEHFEFVEKMDDIDIHALDPQKLVEKLVETVARTIAFKLVCKMRGRPFHFMD